MARSFPEQPGAWAQLAQASKKQGEDPITIYALARVGYHRSLDLLRRSGWKGQGLLPLGEGGNRWVLQAWYQLRQAAESIGEQGEVARLAELLLGAEPQVFELLGAENASGERILTENIIVRGID